LSKNIAAISLISLIVQRENPCPIQSWSQVRLSSNGEEEKGLLVLAQNGGVSNGRKTEGFGRGHLQGSCLTSGGEWGRGGGGRLETRVSLETCRGHSSGGGKWCGRGCISKLYYYITSVPYRRGGSNIAGKFMTRKLRLTPGGGPDPEKLGLPRRCEKGKAFSSTKWVRREDYKKAVLPDEMRGEKTEKRNRTNVDVYLEFELQLQLPGKMTRRSKQAGPGRADQNVCWRLENPCLDSDAPHSCVLSQECELSL